jgi:hypothetical protein
MPLLIRSPHIKLRALVFPHRQRQVARVLRLLENFGRYLRRRRVGREGEVEGAGAGAVAGGDGGEVCAHGVRGLYWSGLWAVEVSCELVFEDVAGE